jgi:NTE family protein
VAKPESKGVPPSRSEHPVVGLALGGGAARGWAHLGVVRALREAGIEPAIVTGTSMGAVIGALLASGRFDAASDEILRADLPRVVSYMDPRLLGSGLIDGWRVYRLLRAWFGLADIESLRPRFCAVATDLSSGEEIVMSRGNLVSAIRASISIPGVFAPWFREGRWLVDGGLVDPVPCGPARAMGAEFVIAVDLNRSLPPPVQPQGSSRKLRHGRLQSLSAGEEPGEHPDGREPGFLNVLVNSLLIGHSAMSILRATLDPPDLLISPDLSAFSGTEFHRAGELAEVGYAAAAAQLSPLAGKL